MLKNYGQIYSSVKEDFDAMANTLKKDGFQIAYMTETNGTVIKEVPDLESEDKEA
jgi:hypothetical protein